MSPSRNANGLADIAATTIPVSFAPQSLPFGCLKANPKSRRTCNWKFDVNDLLL